MRLLSLIWLAAAAPHFKEPFMSRWLHGIFKSAYFFCLYFLSYVSSKYIFLYQYLHLFMLTKEVNGKSYLETI